MLRRQVFQPYALDVADVCWWSAYPIGQRIADHFSKANRVFLTGDACHTHSPKAGQGMNVSLQDGYNIGWKLASVLKGHAGPELLETYVLERQKVADVLINWDKVWAKQMSSIAKEDGGVVDANGKIDFSEVFVKAEAFTAGLTVTYDNSIITQAEGSNQQAAKNLKVGMRLQGVQVVRFCDAKVMKSVNALPSDGRWRIIVFPGDIRQQLASTKLNQVSYATTETTCILIRSLAWNIPVLKSWSDPEIPTSRRGHRQLDRGHCNSLWRETRDTTRTDTRCVLACNRQIQDER